LPFWINLTSTNNPFNTI
jgi:hypothetical protein